MKELFLFAKSLHEPTDNNSNIINTTPTVSLTSNITVCPNYSTDISLLSKGIDSLEQFFDKQFHNLTQMSSVETTSKGTKINNESDILIESIENTIRILKKELINKKHIISNQSIILRNITSDT